MMRLTTGSGLIEAMRQDRELDMARENVVRRAYDALPKDCQTCPNLEGCTQPTTHLYRLVRNPQYRS